MESNPRILRQYGLIPSPVANELAERSTVPLNTELLVRAHQGGYINGLPDLSVDDTLNKSKGDFFTQSLSIVQILWLIIILFIRVKKGLDITQLEVLTVAFALCSALTYLFWWDKPQDVNTATLIESGDRKLPDEDYGTVLSMDWIYFGLVRIIQ